MGLWGDPAGVIPQEETKTIDNINFTIKTNIWWVDDPYDNDASGYGALPYDYKRVEVTVKSPSLFTGEVVQTANIDTLASMEGEEEAYPGGNIRVIMQRGWQTGSEPEPVSGAKVELVTDPAHRGHSLQMNLGNSFSLSWIRGTTPLRQTLPVV